MSYTKSDMVYSDYRWSSGSEDNPNLKGEPDHSLFSRHEGYEMLYLINAYLKKKGLTSDASGEKAEKLLHDKLPSNRHSQINAIKFLDDNW